MAQERTKDKWKYPQELGGKPRDQAYYYTVLDLLLLTESMTKSLG